MSFLCECPKQSKKIDQMFGGINRHLTGVKFAILAVFCRKNTSNLPTIIAIYLTEIYY